MAKKVLIVGGVAGGASTAARLRRLDEQAEIIMFERGEYISFANCGLPYYIGGTIEERKALLVQTPEAMKNRFNIDVRVWNEVVGIDREAKKVTIKKVQSGETYEENYDVLVLSPGSTPLRPPIPGIDAPNIMSLWNIPDTDKIKAFVDEKKPARAAVIGGGFIGIEMAENLHDRGIDVSIVEMLDQVMAPVDYDMAQHLHRHIDQKGVRLYLGDGVDHFEQEGDVTKIVLQSGKVVEADLVILSIGIRPNGELAKAAGLPTNRRGGIIVDEYMRTEDASIYALGDAVEVIDYNTKEQTMVPLAGPANKQGRIVANNICGWNEAYKGTQGTSVAKVFDMTVASTGLNEKTLMKMGKKHREDYRATIIMPKSHAGYYPGARPMFLKLIFDLEGKVLGGQIVGYDGTDKRIDVIATAIRFGATIYDLKELELAYAPPFSSAKDPVNMAGFSAENILRGDMDNILYHEMDDLNPEDSVILDVRTSAERELGYIPNSIHIAVDDLRERVGELDKSKEVIVYCAVGIRAYIATRILKANGFDRVKNYAGGYNHYGCVHCKHEASMGGDLNCACGNDEGVEESGDVHRPEAADLTQAIKLNATGLQCPGPILQVAHRLEIAEDGEVFEVHASDPGFPVDVKAWCTKTGNHYIKDEVQGKNFVVYIQKGKPLAKKNVNALDDSTMVVFSGDMDKALASFIIANGAAAMGRKVTMFFTFWGLNILRRPEPVPVKKSLIESMFGMMMPRGTNKLTLSKMNMGGMGSLMMKKVMRDKNVNTLDELIAEAQRNGVKMVACTMSMDVMGIKQEELIDGIDLGGVAAYLGAADTASHNLFV